jgi:hypothetical protein
MQLALVLLSLARLAGSASRLYLGWRKPVTAQDILSGEVDPERLAASALASRLACNAPPHGRDFSSDETAVRGLANTLETAESRFLYFWERCHANVDSAKRTALLVFLLSLIMAAYGAYPRWLMYASESKLTGTSAAFWAVRDLVTLLGHGWALSAVLYLASSFIERALAKRKINWTYFCARLKNELSRA